MTENTVTNNVTAGSATANSTVMTTRVFMNGRSQAVRIPREFRFDEDELVVNKIGNTLMLTPRSSLADAITRGAALLTDDFMEDGVPESVPSHREEL